MIIASPDANVTVKLIASLNPKRYRVEHIHDFNEGLLRAELVLAHAAVVHLEEADPDAIRRCQQTIDHGLAIVLVSADEEVEVAAAQIGARHVPIPFGVQDVKRVVFRAVSDAHAARSEEHPATGKSQAAPGGAREERRVMLLLGDQDAAQIMAAVVRSQLSVGCDTASSAAEVIAQLSRGYECLVADPELLVTCEDGVSLARKLARRGVPVVPLMFPGRPLNALDTGDDLDASNAGQLAWAIVPQVRRSLLARDKVTRAAG